MTKTHGDDWLMKRLRAANAPSLGPSAVVRRSRKTRLAQLARSNHAFNFGRRKATS